MNNDTDFLNVISETTKLANLKMHANILSVPVMNGLNLENVESLPQSIFIADGHGFMEQLTSDGQMSPGETFEDRINLVIKNTIKFMKQQNVEDPETNFFFYKEYKNEHNFTFKIYVQDMILENNGKKVIRQLSAFFIEPRFNDFYQLSLGTGPFTWPTQMLKIGKVDIENDEVTKNLVRILDSILSGVNYKK